MKNNPRKNIYLIFLIIVLLVIGILVLFFVKNRNNNGIIEKDNINQNADSEKTNEEKLKSLFTKLQSELDEYKLKMDKKVYDPERLCANSEKVICKDEVIEGKTKFDIIPSLKGTKYQDRVDIADGKLDIKALEEEDYVYVTTFITPSEFDYEYCITEYKEKNNLY